MATKAAAVTAKLSERAMLASLNITGWDGRKLDRKVSKEVEEEKNAKAGHARVHKLLVPKAALDPVLKAQRAAREKYYELTLPWKDGDLGRRGVRILTADAYMAFMDAMDDERRKCERAAREFCAKYPKLLQDAPKELGDLHDPADFPSVDEIEEKFTFNLAIDPLPDQADFRVNLVEEDAQEIREDIKRRVREQAMNAERSLWDRIEDTVKHYEEAMRTSKKGWKDTTVTNMHEVARVAPKLTLLENTDVADVCRKILQIDYAPALLRTDPKVRQRAAEEASAVLGDITLARLAVNTKKLSLEVA